MAQETTNPQELLFKGVTVPLEEAQSWASNWINSPEPPKPTDMRAFVVHREDFMEMLKQSDTEYARIYVGMKPNTENDSKLEPCVMIVSAALKWTTVPETSKYAGPDKDVIIDLIGTQTVFDMAKNVSVTEDYQVFDASHPCPPICDPFSPMFVPSDRGDVSC